MGREGNVLNAVKVLDVHERTCHCDAHQFYNECILLKVFTKGLGRLLMVDSDEYSLSCLVPNTHNGCLTINCNSISTESDGLF